MFTAFWQYIFPVILTVEITAEDIAKGGNPMYWALKRVLWWTYKLEVHENTWRTACRPWRELPEEVTHAIKSGQMKPVSLKLDLIKSGYIGW